MSKPRQDLEQTPSAETVPVARFDPMQALDKTDLKPTEIGPPRVFRDTLYTSRTLVMLDGKTIPVAKGLVAACGDDQCEFLRNHPDLEPYTE
ncbi:hypothetical protein [Pseudomonas sp. HY7a-MNA-CIBAN-0227]|uniref:hypothetical protein n=1 Tax=Pseudomonas sp. HY7a-MNA-CIBAN-0227 TaxID=3140474 RepID=UPI00331F43CB